MNLNSIQYSLTWTSDPIGFDPIRQHTFPFPQPKDLIQLDTTTITDKI